MKQSNNFIKSLLLCVVAVCIPGFLAVEGIQARRYAALENEIAALEVQQRNLVNSNKNLITGISLLSSTDRIEQIASEKLNMRIAESSEIIRVEVQPDSNK